ncbi:MAG: response regulator [Sulfurimonas sp.]|jgi:signal transduction histidine kinase
MKFKTIEKILYVEDEKAIQDELSEVIENFCETLYRADDGFQGLDLYKKYNPEIVITDIKMPIMDGIKMAKEIRKINPDAHIVFTTAFSDIEYFQEAIELQVEGYILKPINLEALEKKILSIIDSITLKKELHEKEQMLVHTSKLAAMGEMIGNIAHQWKQPLSVISMSANNVKVRYELGENITVQDTIDFADKTLQQVQFLSQTIDDFRQFFTPLDNQRIYNLSKFINKCIDLVSASFDSNTIKAVKEIDAKIDTFGDPNQLIQAIINILNNAKDALKNAQNIREKLVFIVSAKESNNNLIISIKDNAGGIPENILPRIFEPYFTTKDHEGGSGLGLYITHTIITNNLKGTIRVENEVFDYEGETYKGAKFTITLPLAENI